MPDPVDLEGIEGRVNKATARPWLRANDATFYQPHSLKCASPLSPGLGQRILISANHHFPHDADLEFIAHAREDVPALIAEVRRLRDNLAIALASCHCCSRNGCQDPERCGCSTAPTGAPGQEARDATP